MYGPLAWGHSFNLISEFAKVKTGEKRFALAEDHRTQSDVKFVYQPRRQILPNRRRAATDTDVFVARRRVRLLKG